jgi:hypothetical protein
MLQTQCFMFLVSNHAQVIGDEICFKYTGGALPGSTPLSAPASVYAGGCGRHAAHLPPADELQQWLFPFLFPQST